MLGRLLGQTAVWMAVQGAVLFWPAGTLAWRAGWACLVLLGGGGLAIGLWLLRHDPALLHERLRTPTHPGQARRDAALLAAIGVLWFGWFALMGWDARRTGFAAMPGWVQAAGGLAIGAGLVIAWRAFAANTYASVTVRVQGERAHRVVDSGAYARVRHPMYGGALLVMLGTPLLLGSWLGLALVPLFAGVLALRTRWEEEMLLAGLPGYAEYARRVRHRFVPGVW